VSELVASEGYDSWLGIPVRNGDTQRGTLCLYWNNVITYRNDLVVRAQALADTLGKHLESHESTVDSVEAAQPDPPTRALACQREPEQWP
jgi:hypothetical protein